MDKNDPLFKALECGQKGSNIGKLNTARGAAYEVEKAVELMAKGEEILEFGAKFTLNNTREFDILTKNKLIECKNINWSKLSSKKIMELQGKISDKATMCNKCIHTLSYIQNILFQLALNPG